MRGLPTLLLVAILAVAAGSPTERIVGGSLTTINQHPHMVIVLSVINNSWKQVCGGSIINNRSILSAAHCFMEPANSRQLRVGSTFAHSGGAVHQVATIVNHPGWCMNTIDNDINVVRVTRAFVMSGTVQAGRIVGANYNLADNQQVWAVGWGLTSNGGSPSEQLRHVQLVTVNQTTCRNVYNNLTPNMLCAGWAPGGRGVCNMDSGGCLLHNSNIVGVVSFGRGCGQPNIPGVYARVSRYTSWISQHA